MASTHLFTPLIMASLMLALPAIAANPPPTAEPAKVTTASAEYVPLGTASFGPNGHGSYAWFVEVKTKQVVMCLVHNPQAPIECKRTPLPAP